MGVIAPFPRRRRCCSSLIISSGEELPGAAFWAKGGFTAHLLTAGKAL